MNASNLLNDVKVAGTVAMGSLGAGLSTVLAIIPNDIGKLASLAGCVLTVVLVRNHLRNGKTISLENEKLRLEIDELAARDEERKRISEERRLLGKPERRATERG